MKRSGQDEKTIAAYKIVSENNQLPFIYGIKEAFASQKLESQHKGVSSFIFGTDKKNAGLVASQFLVLRLNTQEFNEKLLHAIAYKTPVEDELLAKAWQKILLQNGIAVQEKWSSLKFGLYILKRLVFNCKKAFVLLLHAFLSGNHKKNSGVKYIQFCDIGKTCLPWPGMQKSYTVVDWYTKWDGRVPGFEEIRHNIKNRQAFTHGSYVIAPQKDFGEYVEGITARLKLLGWFLASFFISVFSLLFGYWINALLLYEAMLARIVAMTDSKQLAREYLFSISSFAYRPLWTYAAERKGSRITNYSYASSFGGFKTKDGYVDTDFYFDTTTWPRLLYWTDDYISFIKEKVSADVKVIHTGAPICFSDHPFDFPVFGNKAIAIFDVSPVEPYVSARLLPAPQYRTFANGEKFLQDIYEVFGKGGFTIVWKRKRAFDSIHSSDYIAFCDEFEKLPNVVIIHPEVSAFRVIEECDYNISMPFTSTAFIGNHYNKPSVFYDATELLYKDDRGAQNTPLLSGIDELENWKELLLKENIT